jgi:hypothetical protein
VTVETPRKGLFCLLPKPLAHEALVLDQHIREGRFQRGLALVAAFSSLLSGLEVAYQHYQGSYGQRIMYTPVLLSPALVIAGVWTAFSRRPGRTLLPIFSLLTIVDGIVGFVFHVRGIHRRPGGWRIPIVNVVMGPPLFAPLLFAVSGYLGLIASGLRREGDPVWSPPSAVLRPRPAWMSWLPQRITQEGLTLEQHVREGRFQKNVAVAAGLAALFSGLESLYSHYKNNFAYKIQWTPLAIAPVLFVAGIGTVPSRRMARTLLPLAAILAVLNGVVGTYYHVRGILRRPGGLALPFYNVLYGAPLFAPLLLSASGFMGLLASLLRRAD